MKGHMLADGVPVSTAIQTSIFENIPPMKGLTIPLCRIPVYVSAPDLILPRDAKGMKFLFSRDIQRTDISTPGCIQRMHINMPIDIKLGTPLIPQVANIRDIHRPGTIMVRPSQPTGPDMMATTKTWAETNSPARFSTEIAGTLRMEDILYTRIQRLIKRLELDDIPTNEPFPSPSAARGVWLRQKTYLDPNTTTELRDISNIHQTPL